MAQDKQLLNLGLLRIGIPQIDEEHRELTDEFERLIADPDASYGSEAFVTIVTQIAALLRAHFDHEEAIMRSLPMPDEELSRHIKAHEAILAECFQLHEAMMLDVPMSQSDVLLMIERWLVNHVRTTDVKIRAYLPSKLRLD
jgi:hemerythrin